MAFLRIVCDLTSLSAQDIVDYMQITANNQRGSVRRASEMVSSVGQGHRLGEVEIVEGPVKATGTITFTDQPVNGENIEFLDGLIKAVTSSADDDEFTIVSGGTAAADAAGNAAAVAALINAHPAWSLVCTATSALGVVTITASVPGLVGNGLRLQEDASGVTNCTVVGFADGTNGSARNVFDLT